MIVLGECGKEKEEGRTGKIGKRRLGATNEDKQGDYSKIEQVEERGVSVEIRDTEYVKNFSDTLSSREFEFEMEERERRRKNIMIRGIRTVGKGLKEEVKWVIKSVLNIDVYIKRLRAISGGLVVEVEAIR